MKKRLLILTFATSLLIAGCGNDITSQNSTNAEQTISNSEKGETTMSSDVKKEKVFPEEMYETEELPEDRSYYYTDIKDHTSNSEDIAKAFQNKYQNEEDGMVESNITYGELYVNGKLQESVTSQYKSSEEIYYMFYGNNKARIVDRAGGLAFSVPTNTIIKPNFEFSKYRTQYKTDDYCLTVTIENKNVYNNWETYRNEWLTRNIISEGTAQSDKNIQAFFKANNLSYTREPQKNTQLIEGYEIEMASILISDNEEIEFPYYNIAIVRKPKAVKDFLFFVMKSKNDMSADFDNIIKSIKTFVGYGNKELREKFELKVPTYYSEETQRYYKKLMEQEYTEWGIFNHSMTVGGNLFKIQMKNDLYKDRMGYDFGLMPTYTHTGNGKGDGGFPLNDARELAGGNGFNGKPVLQFTLQYTANNNLSTFGYIPIFDIYRGKLDDYFRKMAASMKQYGKPILFRLNNEMNTDWCSYSGIVTLCDPDIFAATWERMAKIFIEEGCDNILFIFNPTAKTFPYCSWGEDLCYLPSRRYIQILGLTAYEYNNYTNEDPKSFAELYQNLYEKNLPAWENYPAIISEFGCGAGGEYSGKPYRNVKTQATWVKDMFEYLNYWRMDYDFVSQIKGAIWFNADDYAGDKISNLLLLDTEKNKETIEEFKKGLEVTDTLRNKEAN